MLDIDRLDTSDWISRDYPIPERRTEGGVDVVIARSVLNEIHAHGKSRMDVEVCGVLVGETYRDKRGPFIYVDASIRGLHSDNQVAQVTFTAETWTHIQKQIDEKYSDRRILGWYHTHPGFGIFLSGMDMFIHENFFNSAEQLALVYDPHSEEQGVFVWRDSNANREEAVVHENEPPALPNSDPLFSTAVPQISAAAGDEILWKRVKTLERRQQLLTCALLILAIIAIALPLLLVSNELPKGPDPGGTSGTMSGGSQGSELDGKGEKERLKTSPLHESGGLQAPPQNSPEDTLLSPTPDVNTPPAAVIQQDGKQPSKLHDNENPVEKEPAQNQPVSSPDKRPKKAAPVKPDSQPPAQTVPGAPTEPGPPQSKINTNS